MPKFVNAMRSAANRAFACKYLRYGSFLSLGYRRDGREGGWWSGRREGERTTRGKGPGFTLLLLTREKWIDRPIQSPDIFRSGNPANKSLKENKSADDRGEYFNVRREAKCYSRPTISRSSPLLSFSLPFVLHSRAFLRIAVRTLIRRIKLPSFAVTWIFFLSLFECALISPRMCANFRMREKNAMLWKINLIVRRFLSFSFSFSLLRFTLFNVSWFCWHCVFHISRRCILYTLEEKY